jgi:ribosomal protein L29
MANMLKRQIEMREESVEELRDLIIDEKNRLVNYMNKKAKFYESIRKSRKANSNK